MYLILYVTFPTDNELGVTQIMKKPVIAIDFDDVVGDFNNAFANFHNKNFGTKIKYQDIIIFDMWTVYGVDLKTILQRIELFCHNHHETIIPIEGAEDAIYSLNEKYELHIVTSRCESLKEITED